VQVAGLPTFDWRELHRWGMDESRLPPGSRVLYRTPSLWDREKGVLLTGAAIGLIEGLLVVGLVVNLTRRKRTERSLRDSEERFRLLATAAPVMIWTAGPDLRCTDVNARWLDFTGRSLAEALGDGWMANVHPDDETECRSAYRRALDDHEPFSLEYRLRRHDGEYRWVLHNGVPQLNADGTFAGYIGTTLDVTDQKTARAALSNLSQRLMDAQEQERERLASELHDDVSQRLSLITLELDQLRRTTPSATRASLSELWNQCTLLLKDIQGISRRFHSEKLDYLGIAPAAASLCKTLSEKWGADITFTQDGVLTDISKNVSLALFRVLQEALNNATKHSRAKYILVALRGTPQDVELEISDAGCGFDMDAASRGHGLGLVSIRERLKLVGGIVIIQSRPGVGTTIRAIAPLDGLKSRGDIARVH
jgi:PAS domain S-box-containing protein